MTTSFGVLYENTSPQQSFGKIGGELRIGPPDGTMDVFLGNFRLKCTSDLDDKSIDTGVSASVGAEWGLLNHYCVVSREKSLTKLGLNIRAEGQGIYTHQQGIEREYSIYGGGRAGMSYRTAYSTVDAGFRAGYVREGQFDMDKDNQEGLIQNKSSQGRATYGPTVKARVYIPKTDIGGGWINRGLSIGGEYYYDIPTKEHFIGATIAYSF